MDERDLILDVDSGLLRDHVLWFQTSLQVQHDELYGPRGVGLWDDEERRELLEEAGRELSEARKLVEGVREWIGVVRRGVERRRA